VGRHPYHNFTKRKIYRPDNNLTRKQAAAFRRFEAGGKPPAINEDDDASDIASIDLELDIQQQVGDDGIRRNSRGIRVARNGHECDFVVTRRESDLIGCAHFRTIESMEVGDPLRVGNEANLVIPVRIKGLSFMVHQIRTMIGAAIAVTRGDIPQELLETALLVPARISMPRAPPHTLCLSGADFLYFREPGRAPSGGPNANRRGRKPTIAVKSDAQEDVSKPDNFSVIRDITGTRLELREIGSVRQTEFYHSQLLPALSPLCTHPDWDEFVESLKTFQVDDDSIKWVLRERDAYREAGLLVERTTSQNNN
jgi:hypothetical protein